MVDYVELRDQVFGLTAQSRYTATELYPITAGGLRYRAYEPYGVRKDFKCRL